MFSKFETKSSCVKGLSFHRKRPWILACLDNGDIQLWDYRMKALINTYHHHQGPVNGIDFHNSEPLFVSGGSDNKIMVWDYHYHARIFTLYGHLAGVRSVQFHNRNPWILSASDDCTIRIWNWETRSCISVLTSHDSPVMCASFHPNEDLFISASLDCTARVWDIDCVKASGGDPSSPIVNTSHCSGDGVNAHVRYVWSGHKSGVNCVSFHRRADLFISGADDHQDQLQACFVIKGSLYRYSSFKGHTDSVSGVIFNAKQDICVSSSKDKTLRIWDVQKETCLQTFEREHDRFWSLACHPETNLLAAGHDSGMIVFKLKKERPASVVHRGVLYFVRDLYICRLIDHKYLSLMLSGQPKCGLCQAPRSLSFNTSAGAALLSSDIDGGYYELFILSKYGLDPIVQSSGLGSAIFMCQERFAVLDKVNNQVLVKDLQNETISKCRLPVPTDDLYNAPGNGNLLCRAQDKLVIFGLEEKLVLCELQAPLVKSVVWSSDMKRVALLSRQSIIVANKKLVRQCTLYETSPIKSGAWDDDTGVFIYSTFHHIKYCLPNGNGGIIRTLDLPFYVAKVSGNTIICLDRDAKPEAMVVDTSEYVFKLSVLQGRYENVASILNSSQLFGMAPFAYFLQKGFPKDFLFSIEDKETRLLLALKSGNMHSDSSEKINDKSHRCRLDVNASILQGHVCIAEQAYQGIKNFERLSFLYLITGNIEKLFGLLDVAEFENSVMAQFHTALYLGDVRTRVQILEKSGHLALAYAAASLNGLAADAERLAAELGENVPSLKEKKRRASLFIPPSPILCGGDWPNSEVFRKSIFEKQRVLTRLQKKTF